MGILRNFQGPAVLLELLFISNPQEEKLLASREFLEKCAHAIACGVLDFLSTGKASGANSGSNKDSASQGCDSGEAGSARSSDSKDPVSPQAHDSFRTSPLPSGRERRGRSSWLLKTWESSQDMRTAPSARISLSPVLRQ